MINVYVDDLENVVKGRLLSAKEDIKICVAWINFNVYGEIFKQLLYRDVTVKIILNNDVNNNRYNEIIEELEDIGAEIKRIKMPNKTKYMHHKFCIVDRKIGFWGSFNWTTNASENNFEDLTESDEINAIVEFEKEFDSLWKLSNDDIKILQNPRRCMSCNTPIVVLCVLSEEGYYQTKVEIFELCSCDFRWIKDEYFDIALYNNLISICDKYNDMDEFDYEYEIDSNKEQREKLFNNEIEQYLSNIRSSRMGYPIIHAVGVYSFKWVSKDEQERIIKVLWKEKFINKLIEDEYYIE